MILVEVREDDLSLKFNVPHRDRVIPSVSHEHTDKESSIWTTRLIGDTVSSAVKGKHDQKQC